MKHAMQRKGREKGFTIIELVVVILLLGILTATALPRFMDVSTQAHTAVNQGVQGSLQTGVALFRAAYEAQGQPAVGTAITGFGAGTLLTNATGFPVGLVAGGISVDGAGVTRCVETYVGLLQIGGAPTTIAGTNTQPTAVQINGATDDFIAWVDTLGECQYVYTEEAVVAGGTARQIAYDSILGTVVLGVTGVLL